MEKELLSTFKDESIIVLADWLKIRGSLKGKFISELLHIETVLTH